MSAISIEVSFAKSTGFQLYEAEYLFSFSIRLHKGLNNRKDLKCIGSTFGKQYILNIANIILNVKFTGDLFSYEFLFMNIYLQVTFHRKNVG